MKRYLSRLVMFATAFFATVSCADDAQTTTLAAVSFTANVEATPGGIVLTPDNKYETVTTISWPTVAFPVDAPVTYSLQVDLPSDTVGETAWDNAVRIEAGADVLSKSFLGADLNEIATDLGLVPDAEGQLAIRIIAYMDREVYSEPVTINVTPFIEIITLNQLYVPGAYQGWVPSTAGTLAAIENGVFQGFLTFPPGLLQFKFTTMPNWDEFYGLDANGNFAEGGDTNLSVPAPGSYQITVNLNTMTYTAVPYSWGVIGTATAGGWNTDTDMTYDYVNQRWKFTGDLIPGALKFRLNDSWTVNYGSNNSTDFIAYLDNQGAHTISEAGNYEVTFKLNPDPQSAVYTVVKLN